MKNLLHKGGTKGITKEEAADLGYKELARKFHWVLYDTTPTNASIKCLLLAADFRTLRRKRFTLYITPQGLMPNADLAALKASTYMFVHLWVLDYCRNIKLKEAA